MGLNLRPKGRLALCAVLLLALAAPLQTATAAAPKHDLAWAKKQKGDLSDYRLKRLCRGQDKVMERGARKPKTELTATHLASVFIPRGARYEETETLEHSTTLTAEASAGSEVSGKANWAFAELQAKVTVQIKASAGTTTKSTVSKKIDFAAAKKDRRVVGFSARQKVTGQWYTVFCRSIPGRYSIAKGSVKSFSSAASSGWVLCPAKQYPTSSVKYKMARKGGC